MKPLTRGQLAKTAGVKSETIRFYDQEGLLPATERSAAGYRLYTEESIKRLNFIRQAQTLGFSLNEIRELLTLKTTPNASQESVKALISEKLTEIEQKMQVLQEIKLMLSALNENCDGTGSTDTCSILHGIEHLKSAPQKSHNTKKGSPLCH